MRVHFHEPSGVGPPTHADDTPEGDEIPKVSKESAAQVDDMGPGGEDRHEELDGYTVNFVTIRQEYDLAPLLKGLPRRPLSVPSLRLRLQGETDLEVRRP